MQPFMVYSCRVHLPYHYNEVYYWPKQYRSWDEDDIIQELVSYGYTKNITSWNITIHGLYLGLFCPPFFFWWLNSWVWYHLINDTTSVFRSSENTRVCTMVHNAGWWCTMQVDGAQHTVDSPINTHGAEARTGSAFIRKRPLSAPRGFLQNENRTIYDWGMAKNVIFWSRDPKKPGGAFIGGGDFIGELTVVLYSLGGAQRRPHKPTHTDRHTGPRK